MSDAWGGLGGALAAATGVPSFATPTSSAPDRQATPAANPQPTHPRPTRGAGRPGGHTMSETTTTKPAAPSAPSAPEPTEPATFGLADLDLCGAGYPILPVGIPCPETGLYRERDESGDVHEVAAGTVLR